MSILLIIAGIEKNPGPSIKSNIKMGLINARSVVNKTAPIHDMIKDNRFDLLAVTETWVNSDSPEVQKRDVAPEGYSITHAHRDRSHNGGKKHRGGGVALIHREDIRIKVLPSPSVVTSFEILLVKIISAIDLTLAIIYRPPNSSNVTEFIQDVSDLIDSGILGSHYILCGDLNCPGPSSSKGLVGKELLGLIDTYSLTQHVRCPTHDSGNILDHLLSSNSSLKIEDVQVNDPGLSDHYLVKCIVAVSIDRQPIVRSSFRNLKRLDLDKFRERIRASSVYVLPSTTAEGFASQLESDITSILDELAPVCTSTKRRGKPESRWLSKEAAEAKKTRRRLERKWKKTALEEVRKAYRVACKAANRLITESRRAFYASRVTESSRDPQALWRCVKGLLHLNKSSSVFEPGMCDRFSTFFSDKILNVKTKVSVLKAQLTINPKQPALHRMISQPLELFTETSEAEVSKLIARCQTNRHLWTTSTRHFSNHVRMF